MVSGLQAFGLTAFPFCTQGALERQIGASTSAFAGGSSAVGGGSAAAGTAGSISAVGSSGVAAVAKAHAIGSKWVQKARDRIDLKDLWPVFEKAEGMGVNDLYEILQQSDLQQEFADIDDDEGIENSPTTCGSPDSHLV